MHCYTRFYVPIFRLGQSLQSLLCSPERMNGFTQLVVAVFGVIKLCPLIFTAYFFWSRALTIELNVFYESNWTQLAELELQKFQDDIIKQLILTAESENGGSHRDYQDDDSFGNFPAALLYCVSIISTIGTLNVILRNCKSHRFPMKVWL